ncbi:MAG TPA: hypothetical protein VG963_23390, partial [Polyangiaceae bacterium]|nr:hypothetical protein [Polyangiaceae bacterium]
RHGWCHHRSTGRARDGGLVASSPRANLVVRIGATATGHASEEKGGQPPQLPSRTTSRGCAGNYRRWARAPSRSPGKGPPGIRRFALRANHTACRGHLHKLQSLS